MKSSTKIAFVVLSIIAIGLYTVNGIKPEIKKGKVYTEANELIEDYLTTLMDIQSKSDHFYREKPSNDIRTALAIKLSDTVSIRNRAIISNVVNENYYHIDSILPRYHNFLYEILNSDKINNKDFKISRIEESNYTQIIKDFILTYENSFNNIPYYTKGINREIYRVDITIKQDSNIPYVIYFLVVDEGEGLVIDDMRIIRVSNE